LRAYLQALALGAAFAGCTLIWPPLSRTRSAFWRRISQCGPQLWVVNTSSRRSDERPEPVSLLRSFVGGVKALSLADGGSMATGR
jgi:hypothetical protein